MLFKKTYEIIEKLLKGKYEILLTKNIHVDSIKRYEYSGSAMPKRLTFYFVQLYIVFTVAHIQYLQKINLSFLFQLLSFLSSRFSFSSSLFALSGGTELRETKSRESKLYGCMRGLEVSS